MRASPDFIRREIAGEYLLVPTGAAAARINGLVTLNELGDYIFRKLVSCHEIPGGSARQFASPDAFQAFILSLIGKSFRFM